MKNVSLGTALERLLEPGLEVLAAGEGWAAVGAGGKVRRIEGVQGVHPTRGNTKHEDGAGHFHQDDAFSRAYGCGTTDPQQACALGVSAADTPQTMLELSEERIAELIYPVGFYRTKAKSIRQVCALLIERHGGAVPKTLDELLALPGVGRKTANLVLTAGYGLPGICVDTHVHRICNRWGYIQTKDPEATEMALRAKLPPEYWLEINKLLVALGQNICHPTSPRCSICPVAVLCQRVGVTRSR